MPKSTARVRINIQLGTSTLLRKAVAGVDLARMEGENQLIDIYSQPPVRTGRHYAGNPNVSSAPGEAPAPQTGELRQGVASTPPRVSGLTRVESVVASRSNKAAELELGSDKIEPRPAVSRLRDEKPRLARMKLAFALGARRAR